MVVIFRRREDDCRVNIQAGLEASTAGAAAPEFTHPGTSELLPGDIKPLDLQLFACVDFPFPVIWAGSLPLIACLLVCPLQHHEYEAETQVNVTTMSMVQTSIDSL